MLDHFIWTEKYRPKKVEDIILPSSLKNIFIKFVEQKNIPNLLLNGKPGMGKTTVAKALLEELRCDYITINASMNGNIDTLRNEILNFASSVSFSGGRKYVILDEADSLTIATQNALRNFIEQYASNCGFIFTCNNKNKISDAIHSRCSLVEFKIAKEDLGPLAAQFMKRVCNILDIENITYDKKVVAEVIKKYIPDWRKTLNELQTYSSCGTIDTGILANVTDDAIKTLMGYIKEKDFTNARKWVVENSDIDANTIFRKIYDIASVYLKPNSVPSIVLIIGKYQYQHSFCADPEINLMCCITECMIEAEFV